MTIESAGEFRRGWRVLIGSMCGLGLGTSALLFYTFGLFARPLEVAVGLTRVQFGVAMLLATLSLALATLAVGALIDRFGVVRPVIAGAITLSVEFVAMGSAISSVASYIVLQMLVAALAAATGPVSFTRAISMYFHERRGMALGIALTGIGLSAAVTPYLVASAIQRWGFGAGYFVLAGLALAGAVTASVFLRGIDRPRAPIVDPRVPEMVGRPIRDERRSGTFWMLTGAFSLQSLAFAGLIAHLVPLLIGVGIEPVTAGAYAGAVGAAVVVSRLVIGWLTDRLFAPYLAAGVCLLVACGAGTLLFDARHLAIFAAAAIGCGIGAEVDLIGYCTARYFGLGAYGRLYGTIYACFLIGGGLSPVWIGALYDWRGDYHLALAGVIVGCIASAVLFLRLPRYPS